MRAVEQTAIALKEAASFPVALQEEIKAVFLLLENYPDTTSLKEFKALTGPLKGSFSCRVSRDYRLVFVIGPTTVSVYCIGDRKNVYQIAENRQSKPVARDITRRAMKRFRLSAADQMQLLIAKNLRRARRTAHLTIPQLAARLRVSPSAVNAVEHGMLATSRGYVRSVLRVCALPSYWPANGYR